MTSIEVRVVRSGGIAGLRREWRATIDSVEWTRLLEHTPSDRPDPSADRYVWRIIAQRHEIVIPDSRLEGAWRDLIDRAREHD